MDGVGTVDAVDEMVSMTLDVTKMVSKTCDV